MAGSSAAAIWSAVADAAASAAPYVAAGSAAAGVGSAYANSRAAAQQQAAQSSALDAERQRQAAIQKKANSAISDVTSQFAPEAKDANLAAATAARSSAATGAVQPVPTDNYQVPTAAAPVEVKNDLNRQISDAMQKAKMSANAQAALKAFGDEQLGSNLAINRAGQTIGQLSNFSQGDSALVPLDLAAANAAGSNAAGYGDTLGTASTLGSLYALRRNPRPGTMTPTSQLPTGVDYSGGPIYG